MLNATKLKDFLEGAQAAIPVIKSNYRVIQDEDVSKFASEVSSADANIVIIGVLPSFAIDIVNKDNYSQRNKMQVFLVQKHDIKGGQEKLMKLYDDTGEAVIKLQAWMLAESDKFPCKELFKDIYFETFNADPIGNYFGFCGYMVQFDLKN